MKGNGFTVPLCAAEVLLHIALKGLRARVG